MATGRIGTNTVLTTRWSKAPTGGTTSLSGLDDASVSLVYSVGYEQVYRNGVLLSRGNDYTATNGTTITLIDATITGDIIEVFANATIPLTDTYSQSVANGKFINNTLTTTTGDIIYASAANTPARLGIGSTDQVLKVTGGVPAWGAAGGTTAAGCYLQKSAAQSIANDTFTSITWDTETIDTDAYHSTATNTDRITIPSGKGGKYLVICTIVFAYNATNTRQVRIKKNGTVVSNNIAGASHGNNAPVFCSTVLDLAATDYITAEGWQNSGGNLNLEGNNLALDSSRFTAFYLGA